MYAREINGEEYSFGVSGKLARNVLVMYDRQTQSLWSQLIGEAISGAMIGTRLEYLPSWMSTWQEWKQTHPDTLALDKGYAGARDPYLGYYISSSAGVLGETLQDERLSPKEFVVGLELEDVSVAYPFKRLSTQPLINHTVGEHALLVVFDPRNATSAVFDRQVEGQVLTFVENPDDFSLIGDEQTGTVWRRFTGEALEGPLAGRKLLRLKSTNSFWFGWKDFHANTLLYGDDA